VAHESPIEIRKPEEHLNVAVPTRDRPPSDSLHAFRVYNNTTRGDDEAEEIY